MRKLLVIAVVVALLGLAASASAQTTMTTVQKVKLSVVPNPSGTIPDGTLMVWSVEGNSAGDPKGTFEAVPGEFATWYLPVKAGAHVIRLGMVIGGTTFPASVTLTVTQALPTSLSLSVGTPVSK